MSACPRTSASVSGDNLKPSWVSSRAALISRPGSSANTDGETILISRALRSLMPPWGSITVAAAPFARSETETAMASTVKSRRARSGPDVVDAHQVDCGAAAHHPVNGALGIQWERGAVEEGREI